MLKKLQKSHLQKYFTLRYSRSIVSFSGVFEAVLGHITFDEHFGPMVGADSGPSGSISGVAADLGDAQELRAIFEHVARHAYFVYDLKYQIIE